MTPTPAIDPVRVAQSAGYSERFLFMSFMPPLMVAAFGLGLYLGAQPAVSKQVQSGPICTVPGWVMEIVRGKCQHNDGVERLQITSQQPLHFNLLCDNGLGMVDTLRPFADFDYGHSSDGVPKLVKGSHDRH